MERFTFVLICSACSAFLISAMFPLRLQAERGAVAGGGVTETESHAATESHEQGQSMGSHDAFMYLYKTQIQK